MRSHRLLMFPLVLVTVLSLAGCGGSPSGPSGPGYDELVTTGWDAFVHAYYEVALARFEGAIALEVGAMPAYAGAGWTLARLDRKAEAEARFATGAARPAPTADLLAGWAYLLAATGDHAGSIEKATGALDLDSTWVFSGGAGTNHHDLHLLLALDHLLLGEFDASLVEVRRVDPDFAADVSTSQGRMALAMRIEELQDADALRLGPTR